MFLSKDFAYQRILQSDWTGDTIGHIKPKVIVSAATFFWSLTSCKKVRYQLFISWEINDLTILQFDWSRE